jgi:hypothetical protein
VIHLNMCDEAVVIRAAQLLDAAGVHPDDPEHEGWSMSFATSITGQAAAVWMRRLRPLMGLRRTAAIDAALDGYHPIRLVDPPPKCVVTDCAEPHKSRGLCHKHYMMWSRDRKGGRAARITPLR